mmetsp:Transcript_111736/g.310572  ORF Transcript_111736/g.310572 Transcript_111736/m.310572 type:complete len:89 (-) Transcript_111736:425-691(-)
MHFPLWHVTASGGPRLSSHATRWQVPPVSVTGMQAPFHAQCPSWHKHFLSSQLVGPRVASQWKLQQVPPVSLEQDDASFGQHLPSSAQ